MCSDGEHGVVIGKDRGLARRAVSSNEGCLPPSPSGARCAPAPLAPCVPGARGARPDTVHRPCMGTCRGMSWLQPLVGQQGMTAALGGTKLPGSVLARHGE